MTKSEARTLTTIVKNRFDVLDREIVLRYEEICNAMEHRVIEEHKAEMEIFNKELDDLRSETEAIEVKYNDLYSRMKSKGFTIRRDTYTDRNYDVPTSKATVIVKDPVRIAYEKLNELGYNYRDITMQLTLQKQDLVETLLVDQLETESAREFLNRVPTLDKLLPKNLPNNKKGKKQLNGSN